MKVSQISSGRSYENKDGTEVRYVDYVHGPVLTYTVRLPAPPKASRPRCNETTTKEFAAWAARPFGTSKAHSADNKKFLAWVAGPTDAH